MTTEEGDAGVLKGIKQEEHTYESIKIAWMMCWKSSFPAYGLLFRETKESY